tara:strand:+ start:75 stop:236 length:162 start_codon:yes stop_codon:yes gene_type:complete
MSNLNNILNSTAKDMKIAKYAVYYGAGKKRVCNIVGARRGKALIKAVRSNTKL